MRSRLLLMVAVLLAAATAIVQDPAEALAPSMPLHALPQSTADDRALERRNVRGHSRQVQTALERVLDCAAACRTGH